MNTGEMIALIKAFCKGGGSSLPAVTHSDNGKVLGVVDGEWAAESNAFIVTFSGNTCSHSSAEIKAVVDSGRSVFAFDENGAFYALTQSVDSIATFVSIAGISNSILKRAVSPKKTVTLYNSALVPGVAVSEDGFELVGKNGAWAKQAKKFIVTLTPANLDYSGTMDKTVAEINAAYEAGKEIVFKLHTSVSAFIEVPVQLVGYDTSVAYPSFEASVVQSANNVQVFAYTTATDDGTKQTYSTKIYSLTPAS